MPVNDKIALRAAAPNAQSGGLLSPSGPLGQAMQLAATQQTLQRLQNGMHVPTSYVSPQDAAPGPAPSRGST